MKVKTALTVLLLTGCIAILQIHSIQFWTGHVDPATGWAWSLILEGAALWLWASPGKGRRAIGAVATLLLLSGPLYQVSEPLVQEWQSTARGAEATAARTAQLETEIESLEAALAQYLANSGRRIGWARRIDATQERLDAARAELAGLTAGRSDAPAHTHWQASAIILLQALAICLLQFVGVLAINDLRRTAQEATVTTAERRRERAEKRHQNRRPFRLAAVR